MGSLCMLGRNSTSTTIQVHREKGRSKYPNTRKQDRCLMKTLSRSRHNLPRPRIFPVCAPLREETQRIVIVKRAFFPSLPTLLAANYPLSYPRRRALSLGFVVMGQRSLTGSLGLPACTCRRRKREDRRGGSQHRDQRPCRRYQCLRA